MKHVLYFFLIALAYQFPAATSQALLPKPGECGLAKREQIRNGKTEAEIDEFPWMARIAYNDTDTNEITFRCLAVLISQRYLIAAGHCLHDIKNAEPVAVVLGEWDISNNLKESDCAGCKTPEMIDIDEIIIHPDINIRKRQNDIALLRLNQPVKLTNNIFPICLPNSDKMDSIYSGKSLTITGRFRSRTDDGKSKKMFATILNNLDCQRIYPTNITHAHMCASACVNRDSFLSSSPLMDLEMDKESGNYYYLVALLSYGRSSCSFPPTADVFTRIDNYLDWLKENIY